MNKLELFYPVNPNTVNQPFGATGNLAYYQQHGINIIGHNGIDFYAVDSEPVRAAHDGIVTFTGEDGSGGYGVVIRTADQRDYGTISAYFKTIYWHLLPGSFRVKAGDTVSVGQILALADNTGLSTGTHLHFGLKPVQKGESDWEWTNLVPDNGYLGAVDPAPYFGNLYAEDYYGFSTQIKEITQKINDIWKIVFP